MTTEAVRQPFTGKQDLPRCDLLIIMGTSLQVYPFASMVFDVPSTTPRILLNMEEVGTREGGGALWGGQRECTSREQSGRGEKVSFVACFV